MASSVPPILTSLTSSLQTLSAFAFHTQKWDKLSARISDINSTLTAASLTLEAWQRKYDIQDRRPVLYLHVLFGQAGWERIERALESVEHVSRKVERARDDVVACAARYGRGASQPPPSYDADAVMASLRHIARKPTRSQRFVRAGLKRSGELEFQAFRLSRKLGVLERLSDLYLEAEHPDLFAPIKRLPGRRNLYLTGDERSESMVEGRVADAVSARKDAELLYRAALPASDHTPRSILRDKESDGQEGEIDIESIHIGLHVPTTHRRSFAFLLTTPHGPAHDLLTHPVKIRSGNLPSTFSSALPFLLSAPQDPQDRIETYILPSPAHTSGFHLTLPPTPLLSGLEFKDPISTILTSRAPALSQQVLYPRDQAALAYGIAAGSFRLLSTPWADSLQSGALRWMRAAEGGMNIILNSTPASAAPKPHAPGIRHQIFNIGVLIAEIALKTRLSLHPSAQHDDVYIFIPALDESKPIDAVEIAAEVECRTNVFVGNMVFACLRALADRDSDDAVDKMYCREVLGVADELEDVMRREEPRPQGLVATPRRERERRGSRSNRSSVVYAY